MRTSSTWGTRRASRTGTGRPSELLRVRARAQRDPARARGQAARRGLQLRHRGGVARCSARSSRGACPSSGWSRPSRGSRRRATRNGRVGLLATPATVGQRRVRQGAGGGRARRGAARGRVGRARAADPGGRRGGRPRASHCVDGLLPAAARGGRRHGDPRLHALPARTASSPAGARPRRGDASARARRSHRRWTRVFATPGSPTTSSRRGDYRFLATGDPEEFRRLGTRFLQLPIGSVEHVEVAPAARRAAA